MAIVSAGTQSLKRTTNNPTISACTLMAWTYFTGNGFSAALSIGADDGAHFYSLGIGTAVPATFSSVSGVVNSTTAMPLNTRFNHQCLQIVGTGASGVLTYFNGQLDQTLTADATATNAAVYFQNDTGSDPANCFISEIKIYNAILTPAEIQREMRTRGPFRRKDLNSYMPCRTVGDAGVDHSGHDFGFTVTGTYTQAGDALRMRSTFRRAPVHLMSPPAGGGGFTAKFRKTLSGVGAHVGGRQVMGWS